MASPIPLLPPVTTAVDPAKPRSIDVSLGQSFEQIRLIACGATPSPRKTETERCVRGRRRGRNRRSPIAGSMPAHTTPWMNWASVTGSMWWNTPAPQAALKRFAERLEHLGVCGLNQTGGGEHLRLRLQRQAAQIGFDVVVERQVESSVDPRRHRLDLRCGSGHSASQPPLLDARALQEDRGDQFVLGVEMPIERAGAQAGAFQDRGDAESSNSVLAQRLLTRRPESRGAPRGLGPACRVAASEGRSRGQAVAS